MRTYCEALEIVPLDVEPDWIRADITDMTDAETLVVQKDMEDVMKGKHYKLSMHYCPHEERGLCKVKLIKEVIS